MSPIEKVLGDIAGEIDAVLDRLLPPPEGPEMRLHEAMRYASLGAGKRFRPLLVKASADLFHVGTASAFRVGAAVEMVHAYSLVHDDLPAMDNAKLRRGKPACHVAFDEATAILAGDGLLAQAFEVLADDETHSDPSVRVDLMRGLARASGPHGMVGDQMIDLLGETSNLDLGGVARLQALKTGALIAFCCEAGAILGKAQPAARHALHAYAHDLGLAFQIADDLLDVAGDAAAMGKSTGQDAAAGKATFVALLGVERARAQAQMLAEQASAHLEMFDGGAAFLREIARFVVERQK